MLEIYYRTVGNQETIKTYAKPADFVAAQLKEVPDLQDHYKISKVLINQKEIQLEEWTIGGLFNYLNQ